ncbi:MAG TPA: hypothetical protein VEB63_05820 [Chitinophagaceae bacterium]|nr:hypothetical protein [Chitinophagaceae bacterium]
MLNHFLHSARTAVHDINNYLKSNAEICMDFMIRINGQAAALETVEIDPVTSHNRMAAVSRKYELGYGDLENFGCFEENY